MEIATAFVLSIQKLFIKMNIYLVSMDTTRRYHDTDNNFVNNLNEFQATRYKCEYLYRDR